MRVGVVTGVFPKLSEFFVLQQVAGLLGRHVEVEVFAQMAAATEPTHALFDQHRDQLRGHLHRRLPDTGSAPHDWWRLLQATRALPAHARRAMARAARLGREGARVQLGLLQGPQDLDLYHVHFGHLARHVAPLIERGYFPRRPAMVVTFHGWDLNVFGRRPEAARLYAPVWRAASCVTCNSRFSKGRLLALGCPQDRIELLPMGVDLEALAYQERRAPAQDEPLKLVSVGRLEAIKGIDYALEAIAGLPFPVAYDIAGDGSQRQRLEALAGDLGIARQVTFHGALAHEQVRRLYAQAHLFVLPSVRGEQGDEETQGLVVQEAQATGLPVLVTDIGGVAEGVDLGRSGLSVASGDAQALRQGIVQMWEERQGWPQMSQAARRWVERHYDIRKLHDRLLEIYERAR